MTIRRGTSGPAVLLLSPLPCLAVLLIAGCSSAASSSASGSASLAAPAPASTSYSVPSEPIPATLPQAGEQEAADGCVAVDGLLFEQAEQLAGKSRLAVRVVSVDGNSLPVTLDYSPSRLNLEIISGFVTGCTTG